MIATPTPQQRVCAFCLKTCEKQAEPMVCGQCARRCYCSKSCQKQDWKCNSIGQGHKKWCSLGTGEEGVDWEVRFISKNKGLGIVALRDLPPGFKIIVEKALTQEEARGKKAVMDLMPHGASLQEKWDLNCFDTNSAFQVLCVKISRVNHSCNANSCHYYHNSTGVKVLYAMKHICAGDEITLDYLSLHDTSDRSTNAFRNTILQDKWDIKCTPDCICLNDHVRKLLKEARELQVSFQAAVAWGDGKRAFYLVKQQRNILLELDIPQYSLVWGIWTYNAFQIGISRRQNVKEARNILKCHFELFTAAQAPGLPDDMEYSVFIDKPHTHENYLKSLT